MYVDKDKYQKIQSNNTKHTQHTYTHSGGFTVSKFGGSQSKHYTSDA